MANLETIIEEFNKKFPRCEWLSDDTQIEVSAADIIRGYIKRAYSLGQSETLDRIEKRLEKERDTYRPETPTYSALDLALHQIKELIRKEKV